jgi:hypothetical protein
MASTSFKPKMWLGILTLAAGIFSSLVYFNIIPSEESSFYFGRLPVLFISIMFSIFGIIIILYNKGIEIPRWISKLIFIVLAFCILTPFHIILYMSYPIGGSIKDFIYSNLGMLLIVALFDLFFIYAAIYSIYKFLKDRGQKGSH